MWEALTAVYSVCLRKQQKGTLVVGGHGNLFLTMTPLVSSLGNISLHDSTYIGGDQHVSNL